ncbi:MAG: glycosyltransferase [Candidatus Cloacimonetes bacterium]|nr:glycosyltransferase [Candidatus Cloacimonadota bacterium]
MQHADDSQARTRRYDQFLKEGMKHFRQNDIETAINLWEKASEQQSGEPEIHSILGNAYKLLSDFEQSSRCLHQAVELEPDNFKYLYNYGLILQEQQRYDKAAVVFRHALDLHPDNHELLNDLGVVHFYLRQFKTALRYIEEAIEIEPGYVVGRINLAWVCLHTGETERAGDIVDYLMREHSGNAEVQELQRQLEVQSTDPASEIDSDAMRLEMSGKTYRITPLEMLRDFDVGALDEHIELSIVVPILNERENLPILHGKLVEVLSNLHQNYEIIFVDDGSVDGSLEVMKQLAEIDPHVKVIIFRRNYGQTAALSAGFRYAHGNVIITMDGDLQNDPADIPRLLEKMAEGYDLVNGWRKNRQDKALTRKLPSRLANMLINKLIAGTGISLHDFGCTLKAYKRGIVKNIHLYGEMHRFIPVFAAWLGVRVAEIPVKHHPRRYGVAKYNLSRVSRVILDLLVVRFFADSLTRPIQFFGKLARWLFVWGSGILATAGLLKFVVAVPWSVDTLVLLFGMLTMISVLVVIMGLLGEIMMRIYFETQKKDYFIVERVISSGHGAGPAQQSFDAPAGKV